MVQSSIRAAALFLVSASLLAGAAEARNVEPAGDMGVRPFLGATADLGLHGPGTVTSLAANQLLLGADLYLGPAAGLGYGVGLHLGAGQGAMVVQPLFEVHYRFETPIPLVPWIGGGVSTKLGFHERHAFELAATFRFVAGLDFFITESIGLGMQLTVPDLGPRLIRGFAPVGTVEWLFGPHFRF